jgi:hypothetical protein|nr:MAG: hypothetical protein [Lake Baikal virophage 1]
MFYFIPEWIKWWYGHKEKDKDTELLPNPIETIEKLKETAIKDVLKGGNGQFYIIDPVAPKTN